MHYLVVESDYKKLEQIFHAEVAEDAFVQLFNQRAKGSNLQLSRGIESNFVDHPKIKPLIEAYITRQRAVWQEELIESEAKLKEFEAKLAKKETKTALTEKDRLIKKISKTKFKLNKKEDGQLYPYDHRIYPLYYAGIIVAEGKKNVIRPMRFQIRPADKDASFDKDSRLYKAKRESLTATYFERIRYHAKTKSIWQPLFGKNHGILVVKSFHEFAESGKTKGFSLPQPFFVPCLYDHWHGAGDLGHGAGTTLDSFAVITDQAPESVSAAGYHRSPIAMKANYLDAWLRPEGKSVDELQALLEDNQTASYILEAA